MKLLTESTLVWSPPPVSVTIPSSFIAGYAFAMEAATAFAKAWVVGNSHERGIFGLQTGSSRIAYSPFLSIWEASASPRARAWSPGSDGPTQRSRLAEMSSPDEIKRIPAFRTSLKIGFSAGS